MNYLAAVALAFTTAAISHAAPIPESQCVEFQNYAQVLSAKLPQQIDSGTELFRFEVNCAHGIVTYAKRLLVDVQLQEGWEQRKQYQHTNLHCNRQGLASQQGLVVVDAIYDINYRWLGELKTTPANCP